MRLPQMPGISEKELQSILAELDRIVRKDAAAQAAAPAPAPKSAPARELTMEEKLELLCRPKEAAPKPAAKPATAAKPAPAPAPATKPAPKAAAEPAPKPTSAPETAPPSEKVPADTPPEQTRKIGLICTADAAAEIAALMSYLQEIGREIAKPIFLLSEFIYVVDDQVQPGTMALKARLSESMAVIAIFKGFSGPRHEEIRKEFAKTRVHYHPIEAPRIRDREALVEIMSALLITNPRMFENRFEWDGHGYDETHGVRR